MYTINVFVNDKFIYRHHNENEQSHLNTIEHLKKIYDGDMYFIFDDTERRVEFSVQRIEHY